MGKYHYVSRLGELFPRKGSGSPAPVDSGRRRCIQFSVEDFQLVDDFKRACQLDQTTMSEFFRLSMKAYVMRKREL